MIRIPPFLSATSRPASLALLLALCVSPCSPPLAAQAASPVAAASAALRAQQFDQALAVTATALKTNPNDLRLLTLRGMAFAGKKESAPALQSFNHALKISPDYLPALEAAAQLAFELHDPQARPLLERIVAQHPDEQTAQAMLGDLAYQQKDCAGAVDSFAKAQAALTQQPHGLFEYGSCLAQLGRLDDAIPVLEQAVQLTPESELARYNLALAQSNHGHPADALETLTPLLALPAPPEPVLTLAADLAESTSKTQRAVELLRQAILTHPTQKEAYIQFAYLSYKHSSVQVGIDMLNIGLQQLPAEPELYVARGILLSQTSDTSKAIDDFDRAAVLDPHLGFAATAQGIAHAQAHDSAAALATFRAAARQHPDDALTQYLLAEELSNQAPAPDSPAFHEAVTAGKRSVALDDRRLEAHDLLAALYLRSGQQDLSIAESKAALAIDPNDEQALYHQILALRKSDHKEEVPALVQRMMKVREANAAETKPKVYRLIESPTTP